MFIHCGISDADYIRPFFAILITFSEFVWAIRLPYSCITLAAGHFKETKIGAWVEALTNLLVSLILVSKFGIVGVAIGTVIAMLIRTIEFIYHANKHILKRGHKSSFKRILTLIFQMSIIMVIVLVLPKYEIISYSDWIKYAIAVFTISVIIVALGIFLLYKEDTKKVFLLLLRRKSI